MTSLRTAPSPLEDPTSPQEVADQLEGLHRAGIGGVQVGFYDYEPELAFFIDNVIPILERRGLRQAVGELVRHG
jgi:alkanesulfonate monooxygenase SsuD/methylene tetrahydromethanopterin reductase-like flavin-dependent oxidoreductase (luciferase family)